MSNIMRILEEKNKSLISKEVFNKRLPEPIRVKREDLGLSQQDMAILSNSYRQKINAFELGKGELETYQIYRICKILDIFFEELEESVNRSKPISNQKKDSKYKTEALLLLQNSSLTESDYQYLIQTIKYILGGKKQ